MFENEKYETKLDDEIHVDIELNKYAHTTIKDLAELLFEVIDEARENEKRKMEFEFIGTDEGDHWIDIYSIGKEDLRLEIDGDDCELNYLYGEEAVEEIIDHLLKLK